MCVCVCEHTLLSASVVLHSFIIRITVLLLVSWRITCHGYTITQESLYLVKRLKCLWYFHNETRSGVGQAAVERLRGTAPPPPVSATGLAAAPRSSSTAVYPTPLRVSLWKYQRCQRTRRIIVFSPNTIFLGIWCSRSVLFAFLILCVF